MVGSSAVDAIGYVRGRDQKVKRDKRDSKCGITPPCSPVAPSAAAGLGGSAEGEAGETDGSLSGDDNLVWVSVHMRDPAHPLFEEKFRRVSKLTKVDFNCLNLVVNVDSWVAVLDFFGFAGDDAPVDESASRPQRVGADGHFSAESVSNGATVT
ncbi:vacuolar protein sorting-associated protein 13D-like [Hyposmocoma kahamanoa]|uniref:vacuolar protein sorting-associated protein 13D-like n=1 Tax=Hyposmocoma kahamanoa TaxID=1477025 RepID=UPI000E6D5F07|nr:vacuolar protein sorting-associated protein 13D-like [Hyposmocoma kahamanoa]